MDGYNEEVHCPFCESDDVTLMSLFGSAQLVRQFYCNKCKSAFEFIKWTEHSQGEEEVSKVANHRNEAGVVGSGTMGAGIAQVLAVCGYNVILFDVKEEIVSSSITGIHRRLDRLSEKNKLTVEQAELAKKRLRPVTALSEMKNCQFVIEAAPEKIEIKKEIFMELDKHCIEEAILATNTSSFSVTEIGSITKRPEKVAGLHFFNPVPLMPLVEVIKGERTSGNTMRKLTELGREIGKIPVSCSDTPGFIVNRIARPFYNEALKIRNERTASAEQIDRIMKKAGGFKMGPFELQDLIGIDINFSTTVSVHEGFYGDSRFRPNYSQQRKVQAGQLGRKSGRGFYSYES
ncbi:3-hydroxyacyl-CoA dehydrogenase NAD-binding domain-containing protein [Domibacillus antri]|nr:3-hydroxyacyl-CoA dehydrogenase NAD-binding domain-containing protein [Domibacillus antri]